MHVLNAAPASSYLKIQVMKVDAVLGRLRNQVDCSARWNPKFKYSRNILFGIYIVENIEIWYLGSDPGTFAIFDFTLTTATHKYTRTIPDNDSWWHLHPRRSPSSTMHPMRFSETHGKETITIQFHCTRNRSRRDAPTSMAWEEDSRLGKDPINEQLVGGGLNKKNRGITQSGFHFRHLLILTPHYY